jgi:ATP-dependent DNA helicase RecG
VLIEESDVLQCQAAEQAALMLRHQLPELAIGLIHGRMKSAEKEAVMHNFIHNRLHVLVATTVIEVGVDVPNASLLVIENPERLGLAQLHQLRGRVGRGHAASFCLLMYQHPLSATAKQRIRVMRETNDGFKIAHEDLLMRGPGEVLGVRQTGLLQFKIADFMRDAHLLPTVKTVAQMIVEQHSAQTDALVLRWLGNREQFAHA